MKFHKALAGIGVMLFAAAAAFAQGPGNMASIEFQKPKNGMVKQYEDGRKTKAAWHKQQNDTLPLLVWEVMTGRLTGTYLVARVGQHWADFDHPPVSDAADLEEFNKVIGSSVESLTTSYYEYLPKISRPSDSMMPAKFSEVIVFHVRSGHDADFRSAIARIHEAGEKTNSATHYEWYALANGGEDGEYVLVFGHPNYADFEEKPGEKSYREEVREAFGQSEEDSVIRRLDSSIERIETLIERFRDDLSYMPSK
jgi:hypothetical protein